MENIINKITTYNLFNNLLPGVLFVIFAKEIYQYDISQENNFLGFFLYYFIGLIISRIGSLIIEPLLQFVRLLKPEDYSKFITASQNDKKIEKLSEVNNTYRSIVSLLTISICIILFNDLKLIINCTDTSYLIVIAIIPVWILFILSYRKQTNYITNRIKK